MAKPPVTVPPQSSTPQNACDLDKIMGIVESAGLTDFNISCTGGEFTITGTNSEGNHLRVSEYQSNGFSERTVSAAQPTSQENRRSEARRLRGTGLSQTEIAKRLGVSQKTISNDLK